MGGSFIGFIRSQDRQCSGRYRKQAVWIFLEGVWMGGFQRKMGVCCRKKRKNNNRKTTEVSQGCISQFSHCHRWLLLEHPFRVTPRKTMTLTGDVSFLFSGLSIYLKSGGTMKSRAGWTPDNFLVLILWIHLSITPKEKKEGTPRKWYLLRVCWARHQRNLSCCFWYKVWDKTCSCCEKAHPKNGSDSILGLVSYESFFDWPDGEIYVPPPQPLKRFLETPGRKCGILFESRGVRFEDLDGFWSYRRILLIRPPDFEGRTHPHATFGKLGKPGTKVRWMPSDNSWLRYTRCIGRWRRYIMKSDMLKIIDYSWNPKQPFINGCFNWMILNLYIGNGCFTKHPFINGWLGFQALLSEILVGWNSSAK